MIDTDGRCVSALADRVTGPTLAGVTSAISDTFHRTRVLLPVIHACNDLQAMRQARLAHELGADGVFLINQGGLDADGVVAVARAVAGTLPGWFVGVNLLGTTADEAAYLLDGSQLGGLWDDVVDLPCIGLAPLYFGGVAFKYQRPVAPADWSAAAVRAAAQGVHVVTTSGPATGEPAPVEKVRAMRAALGDHPLALASGITPENVGDFLPYVDAYLVATGIERSFGEFDPARLRALAELIHGHQPAVA